MARTMTISASTVMNHRDRESPRVGALGRHGGHCRRPRTVTRMNEAARSRRPVEAPRPGLAGRLSGVRDRVRSLPGGTLIWRIGITLLGLATNRRRCPAVAAARAGLADHFRRPGLVGHRVRVGVAAARSRPPPGRRMDPMVGPARGLGARRYRPARTGDPCRRAPRIVVPLRNPLAADAAALPCRLGELRDPPVADAGD